MDAINIKLKRAIRKYEFLIEEINDTSEMLDNATMSFNKALYSGEDGEKFSKEDNSQEDLPDPEKNKIEQKYKKLFRKIVVKCHPDKISKEVAVQLKEELLGIYESAVEAHDFGDRSALIFCAYKLEIDINDFKEDVHHIEEQCSNMEKSLETIQSTSAWFYEYILKDEEKAGFIEKFKKTFKDINREDIQ